jgi:hypothetical protein
MVVNNKRHYWIGIGLEPKKKKTKKKAVLDGARKVDTALNPGTQSMHFKTPPRLPKSNQALLRKNSSMMLSLLGVYNDEIEKNKQTDANDEQDDLNATTDRINSSDDDRDKDRSIDENLRTSALVLLQQISKDQITNPVQAIEGLLKTIRVSQNAKQKARLSLVSGVDNNHIDEQEVETCESSFPTLSKLGVPITKRLVSYLLREAVALSCLYPGHGLLLYQTHRGTSCELVKVTRSKNKESFVTNVRRRQSWLHRLPSLVVAESVDPAVGASWILKHLAMNCEDEFVHVCRKMGYPIFSKKMDAAAACAMWQEANVSRKSQRTILRYLAAEYGCRLVVPEAEVDAFGQDHVPPVTGSFEDPVTRKTIHFWTKPMAKLLEVSVSTYV